VFKNGKRSFLCAYQIVLGSGAAWRQVPPFVGPLSRGVNPHGEGKMREPLIAGAIAFRLRRPRPEIRSTELDNL